MRIIIIGKFPPIEGGVSSRTFWTAHELAKRGHNVHVVTNATEIERGLMEFFWGKDMGTIKSKYFNAKVNLHMTANIREKSFLPWSNPFSSKLFGLAISVIKKFGCDLLVGWYFEPYGLVASQLGTLYEIPVATCHAGSDIGRLTMHLDLVESYKWMLQKASRVITDGGKATSSILHQLGVDKEKMLIRRAGSLPGIFSKSHKQLDINGLCNRLPRWFRTYPLHQKLIESIVQLNAKEFDYSLPTIGIYGKTGEVKGNYELLEALENLAKKGVNFNFISICGSTATGLEKYFLTLLQKKNLTKRTWVLPMIAPWRIPNFLRCCNIVCYLERDFPIPFHTPVIPREILAAGVCLVCSGEIVRKQYFKASLVDGKNYVLIPDPRNITLLASRLHGLVTNMELTHVIGKHGYYLSKFIEGELSESDPMANACESMMKEND